MEIYPKALPPYYKVSSTGWIHFACPFCQSEKHLRHAHLYVSPDFSFAHCKRCGWAGRPEEAFKAWGVELPQEIKALARKELERLEPKRLNLTPPEGKFVPFFHSRACVEYVKKRKAVKYALAEKWLYCIKGEFKGRLVIPVPNVFGDVLFLARSIDDSKPRYLYQRNGSKVYFVYGLNHEYRGKMIVLTEGVFDAIAVKNCGFNGIALLGKDISKAQAEIIRFYEPSLVVLLLDSEEKDKYITRAIRRNKKLLESVGLRVKALFLPEGDPAEFGQLEQFLWQKLG